MPELCQQSCLWQAAVTSMIWEPQQDHDMVNMAACLCLRRAFRVLFSCVSEPSMHTTNGVVRFAWLPLSLSPDANALPSTFLAFGAGSGCAGGRSPAVLLISLPAFAESDARGCPCGGSIRVAAVAGAFSDRRRLLLGSFTAMSSGLALLCRAATSVAISWLTMAQSGIELACNCVSRFSTPGPSSQPIKHVCPGIPVK